MSATADAAVEAGGPTLRQLLPLIVVVSTGALVVNLDTVAVNVALDTLSTEFHVPLSSVQWVVTAYVLALAAVVPLTGWASHRLGAKRLWMSALALFIFASALSGLAWSNESLIVFRVLQGLGGGMVLPAGHGIIVRAAKGRNLGSTMSVVSMPLLIGPVFGPMIGGLLVDYVGWRSIFYINIPTCGLALLFARRVVPRSDPEAGRALDARGLFFVSPGLTLLIYGLSQAGAPGGLGNPATVAALVGGVVLLAAFVWHALRIGSSTALIDVSLFARRGFAAPAAIGFAFSFMMQGALVLYPLYWQIVRDESAVHAGLLIAPQGLGSVITNSFNGRLADRYGAARLAPVGLVILLASTLVWARMDEHTPYAVLALATFFRGFGISFLGTPAYAAAYQSLAPEEVPRGTTAYNIVQRCGSAFGVAIVIVVLQLALGNALPGGAAHGLSAGTLGTLAQHGYGDEIAHAFALSFTGLAIVTALTFLPALMLPWRGTHNRR